MNAAKLERSERLQRVLTLLKNYPTMGVTSMEIIVGAQVVAPATVVSELRHQGYNINCQRKDGVWVYRLVS